MKQLNLAKFPGWRGAAPAGGRWGKGEIFVWATAGAVTVTFGILALLIGVVLVNGLGFFWPSPVASVSLRDGRVFLGEITAREEIPAGGWRMQLKIGNRDLYGLDFRWIPEDDVAAIVFPRDAAVLERQQFGNFYGTLRSLAPPPGTGGSGEGWAGLESGLEAIAQLDAALEPLRERVENLARRLGAARRPAPAGPRGGGGPQRAARLAEKLAAASRQLAAGTAELRSFGATFAEAGGREHTVALVDIVRAYRPNGLGFWGKMAIYFSKLGELLTGEPREANTEGGLLPAIFGTVMMVLLMSFFSIPLGVIAAIYLREYARDGALVRLVRIAVFNLAGVPSIVYGVFGLGFFVYGLGGSIDRFFFSERLPTPTFGTGGILWASLTLALLTVPVVIVATEEAFASIPRGIREGSLSLGATQFQTLVRVLLPMATPGILTGFILAMARAAGEVAPLMITGVVKLAPSLPLDGNFPFLHLERKFMHLGFHIFDVGFQSPNVEAAKPMVYVTTLLLVLIVLLMSLGAIFLRNSMRKRFQTATF